MSYLPRRRANLSGLSGVENCGPDQVWDPSIEFLGQKGQCMPRNKYAAVQLENPNAFPGVVKTSGVTSVLSSVLSALNPTATATAAVPYYAPQPGMSTTTKVAIAGGAVLLVALLARNR